MIFYNLGKQEFFYLTLACLKKLMIYTLKTSLNIHHAHRN
jgi:hypothetical protein